MLTVILEIAFGAINGWMGGSHSINANPTNLLGAAALVVCHVITLGQVFEGHSYPLWHGVVAVVQ